MIARRFAGVLVLAVALALTAGAALAEGFVDVQAGAAFTADANLVADNAGFVQVSPTGFEPSGTVGVRGGYWFRSLPWLGLAADLSWFAPHEDFGGDAARIHVVPLSFLLMLRLPLFTSDRIPQGLVQPYAAIGPGAFFSTARLEVPGAEDFQGSTVDAGLDARVGVEVQFLRWLGVFVEYRHTRFSPTWRDRVADTPVSLSTDLDSDHIQLGVGFHF